MNMLSNRLFYNRVYLSGPIDNAPDYGVGWRNMIKEQLKNLNLIFLDPCQKLMLPGYECKDFENHSRRLELKQQGNFETIAKEMKIIRSIDLRMSDCVEWAIVHLDLKIYSTGTHEEITTMNRRKLPILLHMEQGKSKVPDWIWAELPRQHIFDDWKELISYIKYIAYTPEPIDSLGRWRFFDFGTLYKMNEIPITDTLIAKISPEDYKFLINWNWHAEPSRDNGFYAYGSCKIKHEGERTQAIAMHRLIAERMGLKFTFQNQIDHENCDKLDNRRENLRIATPSLNKDKIVN